MNDTAEQIRRHYESTPGNAATVRDILTVVNERNDKTLTAATLAPLDQFHIRGLQATEELAELAGLQSGMKVLDAGSGLGGPSRYIAERYGCHVTGLDVTPSFVGIATVLARRTGLSHLTHYQVGDLRSMPFRDHSFDVVWTQHAVMNLRDRTSVYQEIQRVLSPGGKFVFFDLFSPDDKPELTFPLPWAESSETSFLLTRQETMDSLAAGGFNSGVWNDVSDETQSPPPAPAGAPDALTLAALMGPRFQDMLANLRSALRQRKIRVVMGSY